MADHSTKEAVQSKYELYRESLASPGRMYSEETLLVAADDEQNLKTAGHGTPVPEVERYKLGVPAMQCLNERRVQAYLQSVLENLA